VEAAEYYLKAMNVARSLGDKAIEAQSYYSLGNAYTLLQDYALSIDFHHRHLLIAQTLDDKIGECRAYWSLGNSYAAMGDLENAINYANMHLNLAKHIGDSTSELTAKKNLYDFQNLLTSSGFRDSESGLFSQSTFTTTTNTNTYSQPSTLVLSLFPLFSTLCHLLLLFYPFVHIYKATFKRFLLTFFKSSF
jgi:tetratricopeptide (TPR) repeat protein